MNSRVIALAAMMLGASAVSSFAMDAAAFVANPSIAAGSPLVKEVRANPATRTAIVDKLVRDIYALAGLTAKQKADAIQAALGAYGLYTNMSISKEIADLATKATAEANQATGDIGQPGQSTN